MILVLLLPTPHCRLTRVSTLFFAPPARLISSCSARASTRTTANTAFATTRKSAPPLPVTSSPPISPRARRATRCCTGARSRRSGRHQLCRRLGRRAALRRARRRARARPVALADARLARRGVSRRARAARHRAAPRRRRSHRPARHRRAQRHDLRLRVCHQAPRARQQAAAAVDALSRAIDHQHARRRRRRRQRRRRRRREAAPRAPAVSGRR
jgi:hypothetical protein